MKKGIAIVYMVAGLSNRFGGKVKQLVKVKEEKTLMEVSLDQAIPAGFNKIVFIVGDKTEHPFKEKFGDNYNGIPIEYGFQEYDIKTRDKPWGTTDAVCCAKEIINSPFVVCNGDDLYGKGTFKQLVNHLNNEEEEATIVYDLITVIPEEGKTNRAIFKIREGYAESFKEIFDIERSKLSERGLTQDSKVSMNIFALHPKTIELLNKRLKEFKENNKESRTKECLLQEELSKLIEQKKIKMKTYPTNEECIGITNPGDEEFIRKRLTESENNI